MKAQKDLLVRDWKQDVINLVQFPRSGCIVNMSPFSVKLETWLRFTKLPFQGVSNDFDKASAKGQVPFIELNGRQFADANSIMEHLKATYKLSIDSNLSPKERDLARVLTIFVEESIYRVVAYQRSKDFGWSVTEKGCLNHLTGIKKFMFKQFAAKKFEKSYAHACHVQGIGRNTPEEVDEIAKRDLTVLSQYLGDKAYFFGSTPSTLDAVAFAQLVTLLDTPIPSQVIKPFMEQSTPNLVAFVERVKKEYWPDWDVLCSTLVMNAPATSQ